MESTVVSLFSDYKHGKRFKSQPHTSANMTKNNTRTMPSLTRSKPRKSHPSVDSFHQVEISQRLRCTTTPPPSLQSQSLPRIHLNGNHTRQQNHHSNSYSNHLSEKIDKQLFMPSIQYRATQSLPSLSQSKMSRKSSKKSIYTKDPHKWSTFELFKTSRLGQRTASHRQNFTWDFSPRDDEVSLERNDNCFPTLGHGDTQSTRPVHLYMSVEMMDKLLEKRKGLRSDAALNALIGLPPSTKKISKNEPLKDSPSVKAVRMTVDESNVQEIRLEETTSEELKTEELKSEELKSEELKSEEPKSGEPKSEEPKSEEPKYEKPKYEKPKYEKPKYEKPKSEEPKSEEPKSEEPKSEEPKSDKDVDNNTSKGKKISKDLQEDEMVCEFEDEEEAELGGLEEEDKDEEFDAAEDKEEDADEQEEEFDEVSNDSDEDVNKDFSGQEIEGDDTAENMDRDCDDEEEDSDEELDEQDNDNLDDDSDEDLAGQDKDGGSEEEEDDTEVEEGESDQEDELLENDEEGGELSDEDEQNEASEDDAELISDDDGDE